MKKNRFATFACCACSALLLAGCFNLDEVAYSEMVEKDFTASESDLKSLVMSAYGNLGYWFDWYGLFDLQEEPSDEFITPVRPNGWDDGGTYQRLHKHSWTNEEEQPINTYETCFSSINTCNRILEQIESGSLDAGESKDAVVVELRAVRALWYLILMDTHGNVPLVTSFSSEIPTQAKRSEVFDFVVAEFKDCMDSGLLSEEKNADTYTRFNRWSIEMALMRAYLNGEVYSGKAYWAEALELAEDIIDNGPYSLSEDYSANFTVDLDYTNPEVILAIPYGGSTISTGGHVFNENKKFYPTIARNYFGWSYQCWGGSCANPQFIDSYQEGDLRKEKTWLSGPCRSGDGSIVWTCMNYLPSLTSKADDGTSMTSIDFGLRQYKYEPDIETENYWNNDVPFFRLAEAYLTKAECLLRLWQRLDEAVAAVNAVRARVAPEVSLSDLQGDTKMVYGLLPWGALTSDIYKEHEPTHDWESVMELLESSQTPIQSGEDASPVALGGMYDEWGWEFCLEGLRRQTMIRFGTFSSKNWFNHEAIPDGHTEIFPIPLTALQNNPNLQQNPGY